MKKIVLLLALVLSSTAFAAKHNDSKDWKEKPAEKFSDAETNFKASMQKILDKYVGESEKAVRELFSRARSMRPCVLFFDELDSLTPMRGSGQAGVTDRIVNQFLTEIDGTEDRSGVFILATTSRPDLIDAAIVRPGRIDKHVHMESPHPPDIEKVITTILAFL